jgi:hypothetical protein
MRALKHASLPGHLMPPRTIQESHRPRASNRTMCCHSSSNCQAWSFQQNQWRRHDKEMEPREKEKRLAAYRDETNRTPEEDHSQIVSARSISWAECREKKKNLSAPSRGGVVSPARTKFKMVKVSLASWTTCGVNPAQRQTLTAW